MQTERTRGNMIFRLFRRLKNIFYFLYDSTALDSHLSGRKPYKLSCDGDKSQGSAGQDWVARLERKGQIGRNTHFTATLYAVPVAGAAALSHTKQIIKMKKVFDLNGFIMHTI